MLVRTWFDGLKTRLTQTRTRRQRRASGQRGLATRRLTLEGLEDRRLLAFLPTADYAVGTNPQAVVTADFNGDGRLDLATANTSNSNVSVLLGNVGGAFQPAQNSATGAGPLSLAVGDFNADGKLDLATANAGTVSVLLGNGNGTFGAASNINLGSSPTSVAVGDFNADGKLDLTVAGSVSWYVPPDPVYCNSYGCGGGGGGTYHYASVAVLLGHGDGTFAAPSLPGIPGTNTTSIATGDFNGDGKQDLVASTDSSLASVMLGSGAGTFASAQSLGYGYGLAVTVRDFNGDGKQDVVSANANNVSVWLGNGLGAFGAAQNYSVGSPHTSVAVTEFNGDGKADLVTANGSALAGSDYVAASGTLTFAPGQTSLPIPVTVKGDVLVEYDEYFSVQLSGATSSVIANGWGYGTILDDDTPPSINISDASVVEGNSGTRLMSFTVTLSHASDKEVRVKFATANGTAKTSDNDYVSKSGTITFAPGETTKTITVTIKGDKKKENNELFYVNLSGEIHGAITDSQGVGTILNDDGGSTASSRISSAWAVDAAIDDLMTGRPKKRSR